MRLSDIIAETAIDTDLRAADKIEAFAGLGRLLARALPETDPGRITSLLTDRESLASTGVGNGVAIPHGKMPGLDRIVGALGLIPGGVPFDAVDGQPVTIFVALLAPVDATTDHLKTLARVSLLLKDPGFRERLLGATSAVEALEIIAQEEEKTGGSERGVGPG